MRLIDRIIDRVYDSVQDARSREEHELGSITLRLLRTLDLDLATYAAFGCSFKRWQERCAERTFQRHKEWVEALHANVDTAAEVRREATSGGTVYQMPAAKKPAQQEPVRSVPKQG